MIGSSWRRSSAFALALVAIAASACTFGTAAARVPARPAGPRTAYVVIGASDSLGFGTIDPTRQGWPHVFFDRALPVGATLVNLGVPGATVQEAIAQEVPYVPSLAPTVVTVFLGVNDLRAGVSAAVFGERLRALLSDIRLAGSPTVLVANIPPLDHLPAYLACLPNPPVGGPPCEADGGAASFPPPGRLDAEVDAYNGEIAAATAASSSTLVDLHAAGLAARAAGTEAGLTSSDGFHPSPAGHRLIAAAFATAYARLRRGV